MAADLKLIPGPVPEGSILVLTGIDFGERDDVNGEDPMDEVGRHIEACVGHRKFCLIYGRDGGEAEVWGPDVDLKAKIEDLLARLAAKQTSPVSNPFPYVACWEGPDGLATAGPHMTLNPLSDPATAACGVTVRTRAGLPLYPFHSKLNGACPACVEALVDDLQLHAHGPQSQPCAWCHRCGFYLEDAPGACPNCGAIEIEDD